MGAIEEEANEPLQAIDTKTREEECTVPECTYKMIKAIGLHLELFHVFRKQIEIDEWTARIETHCED